MPGGMGLDWTGMKEGGLEQGLENIASGLLIRNDCQINYDYERRRIYIKKGATPSI